uniref:acetyl-CoA carboxylase carboxyltransferase beta subunit n=1 Tax=Pyrola atropurpurea TaxID=642525 RepID=UPI00315D0174
MPLALAVMDFKFIGGSMGSAVGEKITRLIEFANIDLLPLIIVCASGGARMQEGSLSLMQMAKIACALYYFQVKKELYYISIFTCPTTGGVTASFGMLGNVIIAEPEAYIAFAGKRVIEETLNIEVPEGVQETEHLFHKGAFDLMLPREYLKIILDLLYMVNHYTYSSIQTYCSIFFYCHFIVNETFFDVSKKNKEKETMKLTKKNTKKEKDPNKNKNKPRREEKGPKKKKPRKEEKQPLAFLPQDLPVIPKRSFRDQEEINDLFRKGILVVSGKLTLTYGSQIANIILYLARNLRKKKEKRNPNVPEFLELIVCNCTSGSGRAAITVYEAMQQLGEVNTIALGRLASVGTFLLLGGKERQSYADTQMKVSYTSQIQEEGKRRSRMRTHMLNIYREKTGQSDIDLLLKKPYWMSAIEAKSYGIIDSIINANDDNSDDENDNDV